MLCSSVSWVWIRCSTCHLSAQLKDLTFMIQSLFLIVLTAADTTNSPRHPAVAVWRFVFMFSTELMFFLQGYTEKNKFIAAQGKKSHVKPLFSSLIFRWTFLIFFLFFLINFSPRAQRRHCSGVLADDMGAESSDRCHVDKSERKERSEWFSALFISQMCFSSLSLRVQELDIMHSYKPQGSCSCQVSALTFL